MSSAAQCKANQTNAQSSTGPKTVGGKACSSQNAVKHGLTSKSTVLPHESQDDFDRLVEDLFDQHNPANNRELNLIIQVAETTWRRQRLYRLETSFLANRMRAAEENGGASEGDAALISIFIDKEEINRSRLLLRYITSAEKASDRALAELKQVQKERHGREEEQAELEAAVSKHAESKPTVQPTDNRKPASAPQPGFTPEIPPLAEAA